MKKFVRNIAYFSVMSLYVGSAVAFDKEDASSADDSISVPYLGNFDIMGYKLGGHLSTSIKKTDLLINSDFGYQQIFNVVSLPKSSINDISLFYVKQRGRSKSGGNPLYMIHFKYDKSKVNIMSLKSGISGAYDKKVILDKINKYGIYQYKVGFEIRDSFTDESYEVRADIADKPSGEVWVTYYIKSVRDRIKELD